MAAELKSAARPPLISGVRIDGFRSIVSADVELGRLTVIVGANGSGKTNLLEAIAVAGAAAAGKLDHEFLAARGIRPIEAGMLWPRFADVPPRESGVVVAVGAPLGERELRVPMQGGTFFGTVDLGPAAAASSARLRAAAEGAREDTAVLSRALDEFHRAVAAARPPGLASFLVYAPAYATLRAFDDERQILPLGVGGEGLFKHLLDLSRSAPEVVARIGDRLRVLDWFDGFVIPSDLGPGEKRLAIRDRYLCADVMLDQRTANEGFLFLLFVHTLLASPGTPRFFAVDNADTALNPLLCARTVADIAVLAREFDKQVILTTHNPAMLDGLDLTDPDQRLIVCERDLDGHTRFRRVPAPSDSRVRLSEAFLRGYLGGLPRSF